MTRSDVRRLIRADSEAIANQLTTRQYLRPQQPLRQALGEMIGALGCCPLAVQKALDWLGTDADQAIGRLGRTELLQLAKSIYRFWRQAEAQPHAPESVGAE